MDADRFFLSRGLEDQEAYWKQKIDDQYRSGYGTVLFFEDQDIVNGWAAKMPPLAQVRHLCRSLFLCHIDLQLHSLTLLLHTSTNTACQTHLFFFAQIIMENNTFPFVAETSFPFLTSFRNLHQSRIFPPRFNS